MIVIDSSALIAMLKDEPEAERYAQIIIGAEQCFMSAVTLLETSMVWAGRSGTAMSWARVDELVQTLRIQVVAHDTALATVARDAFLRYGKGRHRAALNMGDCASYALARSQGLPLLFKGNDFARTDLLPAA